MQNYKLILYYQIKIPQKKYLGLIKKGVNEMFTPLCYLLALLLYFRSHLVAQSLKACEICLGRAEREEHIQADGQMILIIGDIEANQLVVLTILALDE